MGDSFTLLNQVAQVIKTHPEIKKLRVEGHTDSVGKPDANQRLSEARAKSVRDYLVKQGVGAERLESVGFGQTKPIAPNETARGREANRRVEFMIVEQAPAQ
jgi:outer membrane protein OmpA-like peptidoglycan-associated protein